MEAHVYTLTELGMFIGILTTAITTITTAVVTIITAWRTRQKLERTGEKVDRVAEVVDTVEKNTNSKLTKSDDTIALLVAEVKALTAHVAEQEKHRAVLAAEQHPVPLPAEPALPPAPMPVVVVSTEQPLPVVVVPPHTPKATP